MLLLDRPAIILPLALLLLSLEVAAGELPILSGKVVGVHDGDSLTLLTADKTEIKVRLEGIDAPELKQAFGNAAKKALSDLVFGRHIAVHQKGQDVYKRTLGMIFVDGVDVNLAMVRLGLAWRYEKYSKEPALLQAQDEAKAARRGLWSAKAPVPPWSWRKEH